MRNKIYFIVLLLLVAAFSPKQSAAQEIIDENFIDILTQNAQDVWADNDPDFLVSTIPAGWLNESSVAIGYKKHILFDKKRSGLLGGKENLVLVERKRMKLKLLDKRSVSNFSELYFRYSSKFDGFGAVIYKADGTKKEIPLTKAVSIEDNDNVPEFFKSFFDQNISNRNEYYKVPVADLLPGDIIEFVSLTSSQLNVKKTPYFQFDPQYELCQKGMPLMSHKIIIETDNNSFITARSINGAPEFTQTSNGDFTIYSWSDKNRERVKDVNFVNEYMVLPMVKFQIIYTDGRDIKTLFAGSKGQMKSSFDVSEIAKKAYAHYAALGGTYVYGAGASVAAIIDMLWNRMKLQGSSDVNDEEYVKMAYYHIRHTQVFNNYYYSDKQFNYILYHLLNRRRITSEVIVSTPNNLTSINDLLFESELIWALRFKNKLIFKATEHSNIYDVDERFINNNAYRLPMTAKEQIEQLKIPETTFDDHKSLTQFNVTLDSSMRWLNVERTSGFSGLQKEHYSYSLLRFTPYMFSDNRTYNGADDFQNLPDKYYTQVMQQKKAIVDEFKERKPEYQKEMIENEFDVPVNYKDFQVMSEGRSFKKPELMVKETFQLGDKVRVAGKKLLINLPGLMGSQLQIREDEKKDRSFDIDVRHPRKLKWQINFTIPNGYTVEGIESLNSTVANEIGSFTSSAKLNANVLTIDIEKIYMMKDIKKDKWANMIQFAEAAYNYSHKMVLLKPVK